MSLREAFLSCSTAKSVFRLSAIISHDIILAAELLRKGQLVAIPTETVYGLGANALDVTAAAAIFKAKNRPSFDPLIIHQSSAERLFQYAINIPPAARRLAKHCWPGPLTLVLDKSAAVPDLVTAGLATVAMRVPDHALTQVLLNGLDFPVAAPSANPFGFVSPTTAEHVNDQLGDRIPMILNGGPCSVGLESTIVGFPDGEPVVYRKGGLAIEQIEEILGLPIQVMEHGNSRPAAPGMLSRHYAPGNRIELSQSPITKVEWANYQAAVVFGKGRTTSWTENQVNYFDLSPSSDLAEAANRLFSVLRMLNRGKFPAVLIELVPEEGLGRAINDRLRRAATTE